MVQDYRYLPLGDDGIVIEVGEGISENVNSIVRKLTRKIQAKSITEIIEIIPSYRSILVIYNPIQVFYHDLVDRIKVIQHDLEDDSDYDIEVIHIPTLYGGEGGLDLEFVAEHNGLTPQQVIDLHSRPNYLIYMLGFTPGFPYLGGMSEKIATPRLDVPRTKISAGSVGIAGKQTGIYPLDSPGGWRLIGKTPLVLFDANRTQPFLLKAGQYIKFEAINYNQYLNIIEELGRGDYSVKKSFMRGGVHRG